MNNIDEKVLYYLKKWEVNYSDKGNYLTMQTICHGGDSEKLYYYKDSNRFYCYTHCHAMNLVELIAKVEHISKAQAAFLVENNETINGFSKLYEYDNPIDKLKKIHKHSTVEHPKVLSWNILNLFYPVGIQEWIDEGISVESQKKFNIRYDLTGNQIIIPHRYYKDGTLVGIRGRKLNKYEIQFGGKYMPITIGTKSLSYPIHENLYGLWENQKEIKQSRKIFVFEAEKSVMMLDTFFKGRGNGIALAGTSFSDYQYSILMKLPIDEIIIGLDKEFMNRETEKIEIQKITKTFQRLTSRFTVSILWDRENLLDLKDSPTDKGYKIFQKLYDKREFLQC